MNEQTKQFYTELQGRGVNLGTETDFETILGTNEGLEGVYNLSIDKGLLPQGFDKDTFKELLSLKEKPKMGKFGETVSQIGLLALEDSDEAKAVLQKQAENDYEKKRIEKTKAGLAEEDKARIEEIDALKKQSGQANNAVTIGADGLFTVRTPEPMLGEYGLPTKVETPANPVADSIERQIATKEAEQPSYIARGEDNMEAIQLNAIERAQNTEEGKSLMTNIQNKYIEEFKKSDEYLSLVKEFREGKKTEEDVTKALNDKYSSKIVGDFYKAISEKGGLMHEYIKDAEDKLKTKLAAEDAYSLSSEIKEAQENVNLREVNKEYSEKYKKLYGVNPDEDPLKGVRMKGLSAAKDFPKWQSYDLKLFAAEQFNDKALNMIEAVKNDSKLGRGFLDSITDIDTWDFGASEVYRTSELLKIIEKVENDKELTKEESLLFDSALNYFATSAYYSDDLGRGYKAGQTTGASMPFMIQFLLSSGTTAAIEGALKGAASAATKKLVMGMIKAGKKKLARGLVVGGRMVGGSLISAFEAALMTGTFGIGKIEAGALNRQLGNVVTDFDSETNELKYIERKNVQIKKDAYKNSIIDNYVEYLSEMVIANTFSQLGSYLSGTRMFKNIAKNDVAGTIVDIWNNPIWKSIRTTTKFGSLPEEVLEEELGGLLRWGLASDVNSKKEAGLDLDSQIDIVLGLAPTSIAFGGIGAASHYGGLAIGKKQFKNALNTEEEKRLFDRLMSESRSGKFGDLAHDLIRTIVLDKKMSQEKKKDNISNIISQYHDLLSKETQELADKVTTEGNEKLVDDYISLARYGASDNIYMTEDNKGLSIVIVDGEIGFNTIQVGRSYFQVADPSKSKGKVSVRYILPNGGLSEVKEENVSNLTAPVITTPTQKFREYQLSWKKAENENQEAFEFNGGMYSTKTGRFINTKEKYEEDQQKKAENEEPSINTKPHHIDRELTVEINGEKRRVEIFSSNLTQNEEGAITGGRISITIDGNIATGERKKSAIRAISEVLKAEHIKAVQQYRGSHPSAEEQAEAVQETPLITDADRAAAEAEAQKEAKRQTIIGEAAKKKSAKKFTPEETVVVLAQEQPANAVNLIGGRIVKLRTQIEDINSNTDGKDRDDLEKWEDTRELVEQLAAYESAVKEWLGDDALAQINAPVEVTPVIAPVVEQAQGETPAELAAPEQETPQDDVPDEPVVENSEVNEEEREPMNLLDGQYAIVGSNSTRGKEQIVKVTQNEDGTETWTSIDDGKTVSQRAYKKQQFPEQDNMRVLGIKEGNEITPVIVLSGLADLSQAKGELKVVPVNTKDGKVHEAHVSLLYKQDADGGWSLLKGVGSRVLSPAEAAKYNSLDALLDFPIIPNVTVGNFTLRDMLEYPTLAKLKSRLEQLGIEYDKQTINTNLETALARWRELVRENNLNEEFKNNLDKLSASTLATYKLYRAGVEPFTAGVPIADTMRTRSNINLYVQLDSIGMLPNNISNPLAQLAVLAEVASDLGIIQKKAKGRYIDAIAGILEKTQKAVEANAEEFTGERKESKEDNTTEEKQVEQPKAENPKQQKPKAETKEETPAPAKPKTNIDSLRNAFVEAYARTQNQAYNTLQKTMAKTAFKGMIDKMSEEDAVALYLNLAMESAKSQGKMQEDMANAAQALLDSKHGAAINAITGGAQQETNQTPVESTEDTTVEAEQTAEDTIDYEALVAERNELQETIYDMEDDEAANANARIAQINDILRNRPEFMVGDVVEGYASEEAHDVAMAAVMKVLGDNVDIEVVTEADKLVDEMLEEEGVERSVVTDEELLDELNNGKTIKVYRAMQLVDGRLYPPMSGLVKEEETGKKQWRTPIELGVWEQSEERPDLAIPVIDKKTGKQAVDKNGNLKWKFNLNKTENSKDDVPAAYNPYIHTSTTPLNDQFSSAQSRPELVTVEVEVPESELTSGYKAEKAKDSVGLVEWKAGVVQAKLSGTRTVILSRYDKPIRIVPESEVADVIVDMIGGKDVTFPSNVVTPQLRAELEARGVKFIETDNSGRPVAEMFKAGSVVYGWAKDGKIYLTKAGFNLNTPVHEYTHLWAKAMQKNNPKAWKSIVEQLKKADALWNEVVNDPNYENIKGNDDAIASEVLSRYSGKNGAAKLEAEAERVVAEYKGMEKGIKVKALVNRVKEALNQFWSWVGKDLFKIESFESVESIADRVLYDMLNNTQLNLDNSKKSSTFAQNNGNYEYNDERKMDGEVPSGSRRGESRTDSSNGEGRSLLIRDVPRANGGYDADVAQSVAEQSRLLSEMLTERGIKHTSQQVKLATPQEFYDAIIEAKQLNPHGWMVDAYGAEDYAGFTCLLTEDGKSGIAIKPNGDIISVFSSVKRDNRLQMLMPMAIMQGGRKLDCYYLQGENGNIYGLPKLYSTFGFKIAATTNFVEEYVPQDEYARWKEEHNGSIQGVAAMYISDEVANDLINNYNLSAIPNTNAQNFPSADTGYGEALAERDKLMILENARANGTIGAINGKKSNLPDELWAVVRTDAFKAWFGDWQNDPANASKVLDENGEPLVVYHGSKMAGFDEFQQLDESVNGFFTTDNKAGANTYATNREERRNNVMADEAQLNAEPHHGIYSLFANIKNPAIYDFAGKMYNEYGEPQGYYVEMSGEEWDNQPVHKFATEEEALAFARENGEPDSAVKTTYLSTDDLVEMAKAAGHDGVIFKNVLDGAEHNEEQPVMNDYIAFSPNQLKSATQNIGTFNPEDNRIEFMIGPTTPSGTPADPMTFDAEAARRLVIKTQKYLSAVANPRVELPKEFEWWREVIATSFDRTEGIRWMMESINDFRKENGMPELGEGFDVRTMVETMESKVMNETKSYIRNIENRLRDNIAKLAKRLEKTAFYEKYKTEKEKNQSGEYTVLTPVQLIERYLIARDSIEREEMKGNPRGVAEFKLRMGVDMVTFVEEFHNHLFGTTSSKQELNELWESINAATNVTIERGWQSGLISLDEYEEYKKRKFYVPERDFAEVEANEDMAVDAPNYKRRGSSNKLIAMQQARGGQSLAANVLANICLLARDSILKANKNEVKKAMFDLLRANEDWCRQYHVPIPHQIWYQKNADGSITRMTDGPTAAKKKEMRRLKSLIRKAEDEIHTLTALKDNATVPSVIQQYENDIEDLEQQIEMLHDMLPYLDEYDTRNQIFLSDAAKSESTVIVWVDGVPTEMLFPNMSIVAKALNGTYNKEGSSEGMKRVLSAVSSSMTVYNPAFFTVNVARDIPFIMTKGFAEYGMLFPIRFAAQLAKKAFTRDLWKIVWTGDASSISDEHLRAFYEGGANTGYTSTPDLKKLKDATKDWGEGTTVTWSNIGDVISYMNTFSEVWTRAAAYSVVRNMGYNNEEGIKAAKNLSVNFNRKGLGNKFMNFFGNFSMFMNAAIQGSCGWYRTFKGDEKTFAGKMWHATKASMGFMLAPAFAGFINALLNPDDDDKMLWYSDYDRDNYILFGDVRIPLNEQIKPFWVLGVNVALGMQGRRTKEQITNSMLSTIVTNLAPLPTVINESIVMAVNGVTGAKDVGLVDALVNVITPQAIGGVYDLANGVNFMGSKLSYEAGDKPQFAFGENESLTARMIAEGLYYLGGGSKTVKSITRDNGKKILFDINAREVDAVLSLIPSTYRDAVELGLKFATGEEIAPEDFATVRRFDKPREEEITMARVLKEAKGVVKKNNELKSNMLSQAKGGALSGNTEMQNEAERRYEEAASNETLKDIEAYIKVYETVQLSKRAKKFGLNEEEFLNSLSEAEREILKEYDDDRKEYARKLLTLTREYQEIEVDDKSFEEVFGIE